MASPALSSPPAVPSKARTITPPHFLADLYTFRWSELHGRLPLVSAATVALCVSIGIAVGHPGGGLIAGGGAFTIGFGANQRIADSRLQPMLAAIFAMASATLIGTVVGHLGYTLVLASAASAAIYGLLTIRDAGLAWVGQQASVALFVASAFPSAPRPALVRAGLILLGGSLQLVMTSLGLRLLPELRRICFVCHDLCTRRFTSSDASSCIACRSFLRHFPRRIVRPPSSMPPAW